LQFEFGFDILGAMKEIVNSSYKNSDLTGRIIGCAMKVHRTLGNGFQEAIYQRCLAIEMTSQGIGFAKELEMTIYYEGVDVGKRRVDFLVADVIMVELKATNKLEDAHLAQALNYLEAYKLETALLINFGSKSLEFKRVTNEYKLAKQNQKDQANK
jgi:GxxExxY protein